MKEQMLPRTNIDTSEVARWTPPRWPQKETEYSIRGEGLTIPLFPPTLGREGDIFMPEPGQSEIPTGRRQEPAKQPQSTPHTPEEKAGILQAAEELQKLVGTPELERQTKELMEKTPEQEAVRQKSKESKGVKAYGQLGGEGERRDPILEERVNREVQRIQEESRQQGREVQIGEIEREGIRRELLSQDKLRNHIEANNLAIQAGILDPQLAYNSLSEAVRGGEIFSLHAQEALDQLAQRAATEIRRRREELTEEQIRQRFPERLEAQALVAAIEATASDSPERITAIQDFKDWLDTLDPDSPLDAQALGYIAKYDEVGEKFLDKIISKSLATPTAHYELSFYAGINLQSFLTEARTRKRDLYKEYAQLRETTLIFHEMNRSITVESGNISAFLSATRQVNPEHLQTATELDGVELVRQLTEEAFGRLYTQRNEVTGSGVDEEIYNWVSEQFYKQAGYERNEQGGWDYKGGEVARSKWNRHLEEWEIERALAFGRNIHASFYRKSTLYSLSSIPLELQNWLNATPTETVVKVLAGLKWSLYRLRYAITTGGPEFVSLLYDEISKGYTRPKKSKDKLQLKKLGKLDVLKDITPVGFFSGDGFDSGWRAMRAYLGSDIMMVNINPTAFPDSVRPAILEYLTEKGLPPEGGEVNLGEFLIRQEYKAAEKLVKGSKIKVAGAQVQVLPEMLPPDFEETHNQLKQVIEPIMDQVNLGLGVLIKYSSNKELRARLWEKTADLLPLRTAYLLSEEGVKNRPGYNSVRGEGNNLFNDDFESKLIKAQHLRMEQQKQDPKTMVPLDQFFDQVDMSDAQKQFVTELKALGREKASELAKISFPHIPFLEDVPFGKAGYTKLPPEVFPRRMGSDFEGFYNANNALNNIINDLSRPYPEILRDLKGVREGISSPEGVLVAQDKVTPLLKTYLKLAEQWVWTRWIPFAKTTRGFLNLPTSWLQVKFGREALSADESTMNRIVNEAVGIGIQRREKLPGEERSQYDDVAGHVGAKPINVTIDQIRTASVIVAFIMMGAFFTITGKQLGEELRR